MPDSTSSPAGSTRERIVDAAMSLLAEGGRDALSTRAICDRAGVQAPTIYRTFGSKDGLLDAVAEKGFLIHQHGYRSLQTSDDPVEDLRTGWDQHVAFGLANPYLYSVMYGRANVAAPSFAAVTANSGLHHAIHRIAQSGLLRVDEGFAARSITAAGVGTTFTLLTVPEADRSPDESVRMREIVIGSLVVEPGGTDDSGVLGAVETVRDALSTPALEPAESNLMRVWLDRLARG